MATVRELLEQLKANSARAGVRAPGSTGAMTARGFVPSQPSKLITQELRDALMRKVEDGERLSDREMALVEEASRQQQAGLIPPYEPPAARAEAPAVAAPAATTDAVPQGAVAITGQGGKFYLVDAGNAPLVEVAKLRDGTYSLPDGTRLQLADDGAGFEVMPGDLTTTSGRATDNLAASGVELSPTGSRGRGRPKKGPSKIDKLAADIRQATTLAAGEEALANTNAILGRVDALQPEELDALLAHPSLAEGIESVAAKRDPAAREAAIGRARERLESLRSAPSTTDRAAGQLDRARQARDTAGRPAAGPDRSGPEADLGAARTLVGETLPKGDFNAMAVAYNALPPQARASLLARMNKSTRDALRKGIEDAVQARSATPLDPLELKRAVDPAFEQLIQGGDMAPEVVAAINRPVNELDGLFGQLDAAMRSGDEEVAASLRAQIQEASRAPVADGTDPNFTDVAIAQRSYIGRRNLADAMRRELVGQDPMVAEEARRVRAAAAPQPQPANVAPGARQPEVQAFDRQPNEMPTDADIARSAGREAALARQDRAPLGGLKAKDRATAFGEDPPVFLRGRDRNPPLETRPRNERAPDTRDIEAINKALLLEQEVAAAQQAVDAATDSPARVAALARLKKAYSAIDKAYPPRLVNDRTGQVIERVTPAQRRGEGIPEGYRLETGRKAYSDRSVNRASPQATLEDLFFAVTGFRRRGRKAISGTNADGMSAKDLGASLDDARLEFGDDLSEFVDDLEGGLGRRDGDTVLRDAVQDLIDAPPAGRKQQRRGGQPQQSRINDSLVRGFGGANPLAAENPLTKAPFTAEEIAQEVASRIRGLQPGTATYDMMVDRFARAVQAKYGKPRTNPVGAIEALESAPVSSRPVEPDATVIFERESTAAERREAYAAGWHAAKNAGASDEDAYAAGVAAVKDLRQRLKAERGGALPPPAGNLAPAGAAPAKGDLPPPQGDVAPTASTPEDAKLDASSTDLGPVEGDLSPPKTRDQIQKEADEVFEKELAAARADGLKGRKAADRANAARKAHVDAETAKSKAGGSRKPAAAADLPPTKGAADPAATPQAVPDPEIGRVDPADLPPAADAPTPDAGDLPPPKAGDDLPKTEGDVADKPGDGKPKDRTDDPEKSGDGKPSAESRLQRIRNAAWKWGTRTAIGGGILYGLSRLGSNNAPGGPHVPPPGAGGGGGAGGNAPPGAGPVPFPPGGQPGAGDPVSEAEAEIDAALERMQRGENLSGKLPKYQTFQQYNQFG